MPDFTAEQIRDARENPRPGDVWANEDFWPSMTRKLVEIHEDGLVRYRTSNGLSPCKLETWNKFTRNATLLRRGA